MKQAVVDRYVDDIAYTLGVEREVLNVVSIVVGIPNSLAYPTGQVAAAKGLVSGAFKVKRMDGAVVDYGAESEVCMISGQWQLANTYDRVLWFQIHEI